MREQPFIFFKSRSDFAKVKCDDFSLICSSHSILSYAFVEITWFMLPSQCVCDNLPSSRITTKYFSTPINNCCCCLLLLLHFLSSALRWGNFQKKNKTFIFIFMLQWSSKKKVLNELLLMISIDTTRESHCSCRNFFPSSKNFINNEAGDEMRWGLISASKKTEKLQFVENFLSTSNSRAVETMGRHKLIIFHIAVD